MLFHFRDIVMFTKFVFLLGYCIFRLYIPHSFEYVVKGFQFKCLSNNHQYLGDFLNSYGTYIRKQDIVIYKL